MKRVILLIMALAMFLPMASGLKALEVTIGSGDQNTRYSFDYYWENSLYQCPYFQTNWVLGAEQSPELVFITTLHHQRTSNFKTVIPLHRNLVLLCPHFTKNIRRTSSIKINVPQETAYSFEGHLFSLSKSNWALPMGLTHNYWQSLSKSNRTLDLSINLRRQTL